MAKAASKPRNNDVRQIVGFSLPPALAREVKAEAASRGVSLRSLFEELWTQYRKDKPAKAKS